jgi:protein-L-isoaspartate(D-aspartate) O-methyltransferase
MKDTFRHKGLRQILVDELIGKGISDQSVLSMINEIPRHLFMDNAFVQFAYKDKAFPIGSGQTISQPYTVAFQTELLQLNPYEKVLEVGTGSGYQAAVLIGMEANVYTIERQKELFTKTKDFLPKLGYNCNFYYGDGYKGKEVFAPYNGIIVTCGAPFVPKSLLSQLAIGGRLVIPVGEGETQRMLTIDRVGESEFHKKDHGVAAFVPMLEAKARD